MLTFATPHQPYARFWEKETVTLLFQSIPASSAISPRIMLPPLLRLAILWPTSAHKTLMLTPTLFEITRLCFIPLLIHIQGSPQANIKAERAGVVWAEFVTTSIDSLPTSKNTCILNFFIQCARVAIYPFHWVQSS